MAENDTSPRPMSDSDISAPPAGAEFQPAAPLKDQGVDFEPSSERSSSGGATGSNPTGSGGGVRQQLTETSGKLQGQATDKARQFADMGKERAAGALDQLAAMLTDAAGQVDAKLGAQYGTYARTAAETVQRFSGQVREQNFDQLLDQGRDLVRKSPAIAIGAAAAVGFVLSRVVQSGIEDTRA